MKPLIILSGPTAVGKTDTSIELAKRINGEIISADSMQVYRGMDIGTAKITTDEMKGIRHYLVNIIEPQDDFNVYIFKSMAKKAVEEIYSHGNIPIIVGGTGFYIQSVLYDIDFSETDNDFAYRHKLEDELKSKGAEYLFEMLREVDPKSCETIHMNNTKRVIRALEYYHMNHTPISSHNEEQRQKSSPYDYRYFVLTDERDRLYERIDRRVDIMVERGLADEVKKLYDMGVDKKCTNMQGIGYKEMLEYIKGNVSLETAIETIKLNTRHFAKRQLTWFKREPEAELINIKDYGYDKSLIVDYMIKKTEGIVK